MPDIDLASELPARFDRGKLPALSQEFPTFPRSEVINAFNSAFNLYDHHIQELASNKGADAILEKWKKGEDLSLDENNQLRALDPETKKKLSDYQIVAWGKRLTIDKDKGSYTLTFPGEGGQIHSLREGCPIDPVLKLLIEEIDKLQQQIQALQADQRAPLEGKLNELNKTAFILANSSKEYRRHFANPTNVTPGTREHSRVRLEAYSIYQNPLRQTGDHRNDFFAAMGSLQNRWELSLPARTKTAAAAATTTANQTATPIAATPTDIEPQVVISPVTAAGTTPSPLETATTGAPTLSPTTETTAGTATTPTATETTTPATGTAAAAEGTPSTTIDPLRQRGWEINILSNQETASKDAHEMAREHLNKVLREDKWYKFWKWPKKIWFRLVEGGALQVYKDRVMQAIFRHNTSHLTYEDATKAAAQLNDARAKGKTELEEIVKRFKTGEQALKPGEEIVTSQGELRRYLIDNLLNPIIQGNITTPEQVRERLSEFVKTHINDPQVERLFGASANDFGDVAEMFATDILTMGEQMKNNLQAHHQTLADIDNQITIKLGIARAASRTESRDAVDRAVAWAKRRRAQTLASGAKGLGFVQGIILNPLVVGASTGLAVYGGMRALGIAGRIATPISIFSGGLSGGIVAGIRRGYELGVYDRPHFLIQKAYGGRTPTEEEINAQLRTMPGWKGQLLRAPMVARMAGLYRMSDLEKFSYNTAGVSELINGGGQEFDGVARIGIQQLIDRLNQNPSDQEARRNLAKRLSEVHTRLTFSYANKVDIINWESREKRAEGERRLVEETGRLRAALSAALRGSGIAADRIDAEIQNLENQFRDQWRNSFTADKSKKDKDFTVYQIREAAGAFAFAGSVGAIMAPFAQEFLALGERAVGINAGQTILEGAVNRAAGVAGHPEFLAAAPTIDTFQEAYNNGGVLDLDGIHKVFVDRSHNVQVLDQSGNPLSHPPMQLTPDGHINTVGHLDPAIEEAFRHGRMGIGATTTTEDLIKPANTSLVEKSITLDGHTLDMKIPQGILPNGDPWHGEWVHDTDGKSGFWDLVAWDDKLKAPIHYLSNNKVVHLFNDVQFDASGHLVNTPDADDLVSYTPEATISDPQWVSDLSSGKEVFGNSGYSFLADKGILHVFKNGHEIKIYDPANYLTQPVKISFVDGKAFIDYGANPQNTVPDVLLDAIKSTNGAVVPNADFGIPRIADIDWQNHLKGIEVFNTQTKLLTDADMIPRVPWPTTATGEHFPFTAKAFDNFLDLKTGHFNATHFFTDGDVVTENGVRVIKFDNGAVLFGSDDMMDAFLKVKAGGPDAAQIMHDRFAFWYARPDDWNAAVLRTSTMEANIPSQFNGKVWGSFGFVEGDGKLHKLIGSGPTENLHTPINLVKIIPPVFELKEPITDTVTAYDITPPLEIPPIVFPFAPRHPLEKLLFIYGYGGYGGHMSSELGLLDWGEFRNRRSATLNNNPQTPLNERREVESYLNGQPPQYRQELDNIDRLINRPMAERCRLVIAIPAFEEEKNIRRTLEQLVNQKDRSGNPLNPELFEIIVVDNHPSTIPKDNTENEIRRFMIDHPGIKVSYAHKPWATGEGCVGNARKYANDIALLRSNKRTNNPGDLILVSMDADLEKISDRYVTDIIQEFDSKPELDAVAGKWTLPEDALKKPNVRAAERLWYILDRIIQRDAVGDPQQKHLRAPGLVGRNAAFKASIYAAVGGYNPKARIAEDLEIGWMINDARGWNPSRMNFLNRAELTSNPRRFLAAMVQGIPLIQMYGGFHENREVRRLNNQELLNRIPDTFDTAQFEKEADAIWQANQSGQYQWLGGKFSALFDRTLKLIGADYRIENGHVKIVNVDKLLAGLNNPP